MSAFRKADYEAAEPVSGAELAPAFAEGAGIAEPSHISFVRKLISAWWITFAMSSVCVVSGHLLIKAGLNAAATSHVLGSTPAGRILHIVFQPEVLVGLMIYMFGTACWMAAVSQKEISFLYPLSSVNYVLVVVASALLFTETVSLRRGSGVLLIVIGMILLNRQTRKENA